MDFVDVVDSGGVRTLTLNEPKRRNALSLEMRVELRDAVRAAMDDARCRVVVLTGAGGFFCAGGDISSMSADPAAGEYRLRVLSELAEALAGGPKPVVAAVEGGAFGAGLSLVALADHVVAADDARFCASFGTIGLGTDGGLSWSLPRRIGRGRATEMIMFGEVMEAAQAQRIGLVERLTAPGTALEAAQHRAALLAARSRDALAANKAALSGAHADLTALLATEKEAQLTLLAGPDFAEGRAAFFEKRKAVFPA
ncbi:enoyl-CoA hydratase/isomerase family protein [Pseudonocardia acidicola]|uniref:Enoyl-CoA hydratase n=1 Tax=Pseudonocardia acidicola TaxID=2724939 RepID=A0ABX1S6Q7_9PSEU|nr:enoyl-CoA hydratase-related protein [Pseudonocardia acidicola]NMH95929.1 hypothetical protein [Pseudonocardia acidicola]